MKYLTLKKTIKEVKITDTITEAIQIELYYNPGGISYITGDYITKGYWLSVRPIKIEQRDGYKITTCTAWTGLKELVLIAGRYSSSTLQKTWYTIQTNGKIENLLQKAGL